MKALLKYLFGEQEAISAPAQEDWRAAFERPVFGGLSHEESERLLVLSRGLLNGKTFTPVAGADPSGEDLALIASQAALPILKLGESWYAGWSEVVLYPGEFLHDGEETDEIGLVHRVSHARAGEAWQGGPLILSLESVRASGWREGYNVVIHEFAHKLDMQSGSVNGLPPLHGDMQAREWAAAFEPAFLDLARQAEAVDNTDESGADHLAIDPYAAQSPAEFFAVLSEYFFEWPELVQETYPAVYEQLRRFYRQDPLQRFNTLHGAVS
jgi:hypothetical protein